MATRFDDIPACLAHVDPDVLRRGARRYTKRSTTEALQTAAEAPSALNSKGELGWAPYNRWRTNQPNPDAYPTAETIILWWGSWFEACDAAGVDAAGRGAFSDEEIGAAVVEGFRDTVDYRQGAPYTRAVYEMWRSEALAAGDRDRIPSPNLIPSGRWKESCVEFGLPADEVGVFSKVVVISDADIIGYLQKASRESESLPLSVGAYRAWAKKNKRLDPPSLSTIQRRLGGPNSLWSAATNNAGVGVDDA